MRPDFGSHLKRLVFSPNDASTANLAVFYVKEALGLWEPRIELEAVIPEIDNGLGRLIITIRYKIKATHETDNLIYPLYLSDETRGS